MRPFDVQTRRRRRHAPAAAWPSWPPAKARRSSPRCPAFLNALAGKGVHVTTVNDYLARRDAEWMAPIYKALGLTVGVLQQQMGEQDRAQAAYRCDITYGTATEFGFDFLRDRLKVAAPRARPGAVLGAVGQRRQRRRRRRSTRRCSASHHFALVDEADNIFIDEARTPLIIAGADAPGHARGAGRLPLGRPAGPADEAATSTSPSTRRSRSSS